ncbi:chemotaxis protein CheB [Paraburkholderia sp. D1E]|uniref:chemotaxis protein CheB n=1 Tax=Paraburkholderia sp. D1E TaxID=3461398 RepID=UPI0040464795
MPVRDIVVVGGSLGGLDALRSILDGLPRPFPGCMLVVLHTGPSSPGLLAKMVAPFTSLKAAYANGGEAVEAGRLFIAPAGCHMTIGPGGSVKLEDGPKVRHARPAADRLFESAARAFGPRVVGVVLTGGDHDGTDGLQAIKDAGGICIVQDPADARNPDMPLSAIRGDHPHIVLPLSEIPLLLASLVRG